MLSYYPGMLYSDPEFYFIYFFSLSCPPHARVSQRRITYTALGQRTYRIARINKCTFFISPPKPSHPRQHTTAVRAVAQAPLAAALTPTSMYPQYHIYTKRCHDLFIEDDPKTNPQVSYPPIFYLSHKYSGTPFERCRRVNT